MIQLIMYNCFLTGHVHQCTNYCGATSSFIARVLRTVPTTSCHSHHETISHCRIEPFDYGYAVALTQLSLHACHCRVAFAQWCGHLCIYVLPWSICSYPSFCARAALVSIGKLRSHVTLACELAQDKRHLHPQLLHHHLHPQPLMRLHHLHPQLMRLYHLHPQLLQHQVLELLMNI